MEILSFVELLLKPKYKLNCVINHIGAVRPAPATERARRCGPRRFRERCPPAGWSSSAVVYGRYKPLRIRPTTPSFPRIRTYAGRLRVRVYESVRVWTKFVLSIRTRMGARGRRSSDASGKRRTIAGR